MEEEKEKAKRQIVQRFQSGIYRYSQEKIICGKAACTKCPHGPYWYVRWRVRDRIMTRYIGKELRLIKSKGKEDKKGHDDSGETSELPED